MLSKSVLRLLGGVTLSATLSLHLQPVYGQVAAGSDESPSPGDAPAASGDDDRLEVEDIVVTGTRIQSNGYSAPTPTTVINAEDLLKSGQPNVFTTISRLPSLQGSTGVTTGTNSTSSGTQGLSSFALRGLSPIRTLTLLDGQRVVGANITGVPDISQFPQLLIKRVDVVTGGASASYGSDAVGGVVNFITEKHFEGLKAQVTGGQSTYGDDGQYLVGLAAGSAFLDQRLHVEVSAEYANEDGVGPGGFGEDAPGARDWWHAATLANRNVTNDGSPQYVRINNAQSFQYAKYGLITNGPLQGTQFDANGNPTPFLYGSNGVPARNAAGQVIGCFPAFCVGGDNSGAVGIGTTLKSALERKVGYTRVGWNLNDENEIYATFNWAQVDTSNQPNPGSARQGITIQCSNPFVPLATQAACAQAGITSFGYGVTNAILPNIFVEPSREQQRAVIGAEGSLKFGSVDWHYDTYYQHGENTTDIQVSNMPLNARYSAAIQAISLGGQTVCSNATARASGCVPLNIFGNPQQDPAAVAYVVPENGPFQHTTQQQDAASIAFSADPFSNWAGPVSIAFGGEYRKEQYRVRGDAYGNGVSADSPLNDQYPADPLLTLTGPTAGGNWYAGNYHNGSGDFDVNEAFLETNVPMFDSVAMGKANLNLAGRYTNYSTSGTVYTWKVGGTWQTPYEPVRFRAVFSHDIRAPNLSELFAAPISINTPGITDPSNGGAAVTVSQNTVGNPNLDPESARNLEVGIVLTNPDWSPGFSASVDYYHIKIKDAIATFTAQQQVNLCYLNGLTQFCNSFDLRTTGAMFVNVQPFNQASLITSGIDVEGSYSTELSAIGVPGSLTFRALATHVISNTTDPGLPGAAVTQNAGNNNNGGTGTPDWKAYFTESWDYANFGFDLTQRYVSDGVYGNQYVVCQSNCPISTANNPTINDNHMAGAFYLDVGARYSFTDKLNAFVKVDNALDKDPVAAPQTNTGVDINPFLYDTLGRIYRAGVRYSF